MILVESFISCIISLANKLSYFHLFSMIFIDLVYSFLPHSYISHWFIIFMRKQIRYALRRDLDYSYVSYLRLRFRAENGTIYEVDEDRLKLKTVSQRTSRDYVGTDTLVYTAKPMEESRFGSDEVRIVLRITSEKEEDDGSILFRKIGCQKWAIQTTGRYIDRRRNVCRRNRHAPVAMISATIDGIPAEIELSFKDKLTGFYTNILV